MRSDIKMRNAKARRYSRNCRKRRIEKMLDRLLLSGLALVSVLAIISIVHNAEPRYAIARESGNGMHYEYVTERKCTVTDVQNVITVSYNGNEYAFYGDGFQEGDKVICKFTDDYRIVDAEIIK